jgi:hypothetical protein
MRTFAEGWPSEQGSPLSRRWVWKGVLATTALVFIGETDKTVRH